ncbi:hypothetical protein VTJ49DRAFT_5696 [Mycothermus thermophilus]|uniref:C2H2-type domain-containing protein n=1 Tax=Humicola insolens TaxID=85995 RepID=A0ABR3V2Q6_HUMIN
MSELSPNTGQASTPALATPNQENNTANNNAGNNNNNNGAQAAPQQTQQTQQQQQQQQQGQTTAIGTSASPVPASTDTTPAPSTSAPGSSSTSSTGQDESLICRWEDCRDSFTSAEALYEHLCERHVGRKSTNNLQLTCQWNNCRTTTVKRDHITSHIRVHVPLKPHKCDNCGKSFKRPQDLKKHIKTHADDPNAIAARAHHDPQAGPAGLYRPPPGPRAPTGFYDPNAQMRGAGAAFHQGPTGYYAAPQPQPAYTPMYYQQQQPQMGGPRPDYMGNQAAGGGAFASDRRRDIETLNEWFGNVKRSQIDPRSYSQIGRSLMPIHSAVGFHAGGGLATEYMPQAPHTLASGGAGPLTQHYSLPPMPNLRTKEDLQQIDYMLEQMQETIYVNSTGSPKTQHYPQVDMRGSPTTASAPYGSRPSVDGAYAAAVSAAQVVSPISASTHSNGGTPAVTPPSSAMSYTSGGSPTTSSSGLSPTSRHSSTSVSYPTLPSRPNLPFPSAAGLGSSFAHSERRLSGGMLQRASAPTTTMSVRSSDEDRTPTPKASEHNATVGSPSDGGSEAGNETETYDDWVQHMRTIEYLRGYVRHRLERQDYEEPESSAGGENSSSSNNGVVDNSRIDPMLHAANERGTGRDRVNYPSLPPP